MHVVSEDHAINRDRREQIKYVGFTVVVGVLLLLNLFGIFDSLLGIDTAIFLAVLAGYKTFYRAISELLDRKISADLAIVIAAGAATRHRRVSGGRRGHVHHAFSARGWKHGPPGGPNGRFIAS